MIEFKEFEESWGSRSGFDITPMLDMIFILLIFFLLTASATSPVISVDLPETGIAESSEPQEVVVSIDREGRLFLNGESLQSEALGPALEQVYSERASNEIFIESDEAVDFGLVVDVMEICRKSGAEGVSFIVDEE